MTSAPPMTMASRTRTISLIVILFAVFIDLIGVTILNVVIPSIQTNLHAGPAALQWIQVGYSLPLAVGIVSGARLGDLYGHKLIFIIGMAGVAVTSVLCAVADTPGVLVGARVAQGLFAAAAIPQVLSQIQVMYSAQQRGGPMAAYSSLAGLAATVGPIVGPLLLKWNLLGQGWRMAFWVNVPFALIIVIASAFLLPESKTPDAGSVDVLGVLISGAGLLLVLYPLTSAANASQWPVWSYVSIVAGLAVLAGFAAHQKRVSARGGTPLVEMSLFRFRSAQGGLLVQFLFFVPTMGFFLVYMLFLQLGLGMSSLSAGLLMLPWSVAVLVFAMFAATMMLPRIGRLTIQLGVIVLAAGFALTAIVAGSATAQTGWNQLIWGVLIGGAGMGMLVAPLMQLTLTDVPVESAGSGSALYNTVTQLAASVGIAVIGTVFFTGLRSGARTTSSLPGQYGSAISTSLWVGIGLLVIAFAASFLLPRHSPVASAAPAELSS